MPTRREFLIEKFKRQKMPRNYQAILAILIADNAEVKVSKMAMEMIEETLEAIQRFVPKDQPTNGFNIFMKGCSLPLRIRQVQKE